MSFIGFNAALDAGLLVMAREVSFLVSSRHLKGPDVNDGLT